MNFPDLMNLLFDIKKKAPDMTFEPVARQYGQSKVVITIPVFDENAELLIQASKMFAPVQSHCDPWTLDRDEPPF